MASALTWMVAPASAQLARVTATERVTEKRVGTASWQKAARGEALGVGDGLRTGRRSKADLKFADGSLLRLGQLSTVELKSAKGASLTGGRLLFSMLKPGRVLAGTAAAEIKGSVGIISISDNGSAEFALYSGAMDVVTDRETVSIPPGQAMTVFADGSHSLVRPALPLRSTATSTESSLLEAPSEAPFMGSQADLRARFTPSRIAIDSSMAQLKQSTSSPFSAPVAAPGATPAPQPTSTPQATPIPGVTPIPKPTPGTTPIPGTTPVPQPTPGTTPIPGTTPRPQPTPGTTPIPQPVPTTVPGPTPRPTTAPTPRPGNGNGNGNGNGDGGNDGVADGNNGRGNDGKLARVRASSSNLASPDTISAPSVSSRRRIVTPSSDSIGMTGQIPLNPRAEAPRFAMASSEPVRIASAAPTFRPVADGITAEEHILQSNPDLGRGFRADATGVTLSGEGGSRVLGGRLRAIATRGRVSAEVALSPAELRFGGNNQRRYTLSDASFTFQTARGDVQIGRQRFLSGPALVTGMGSMVRQGGRQVMDAVTFRPNLSKGRFVEVAYLNDAFVRDLPFRVRGRQQGFYGRFGVERRAGNFGINVLNLSNLPTGRGTGTTFDFALPVVRDNVELYGEIGRDPFSRNLRTFGLAFPGLQTRTGVELYVEHSAIRAAEGLLDSPEELAFLAYKQLAGGVFLAGGFSHFSDGRNLGTLGLAFGTASSRN